MTEGKKKLIVAAAVVAVVFIAGILLSQKIPETVSAPLFILVVIVEVIIAPIPGGAIGYLGAARFGFWEAWPLLYIGNVVGTIIVFTLARRYGTPLFEENTTSRTRQRYNWLLERHPLLLWLCYMLPIFPADVMSVMAGLSKMTARRFFLIALTGYFFYTAIISYIGSSVAHLIGITDALSIIGMVFAAGIMWWLWTTQKKKKKKKRMNL